MDNSPADDDGTRPSGVLAGSQTAGRSQLRLAATFLFSGVAVSLLAGSLHADSASANDHPAAFAAYAGSGIWTAVHLGQFVGMALLVVGLLVLLHALKAGEGAAAWAGRIGAVLAVAALALYAALQAVDGVALKHAVDAWAVSAGPEKSMRFATAEGIRWLEWGMRSYQSFVLGAALILAGLVMLVRGISRGIGVLMGLSGLAYVAQGWVIGAEGFSAANAVPTLSGIVLTGVWSVWLLILAWRMKEEAPPVR